MSIVLETPGTILGAFAVWMTGCPRALPWALLFEPFRLTIVLVAIVSSATASDDGNWFPFDPKQAANTGDSPINLRRLNEKFAGEHGVIKAKEGRFIHSANGRPVRFWAVNGPPHELTGEPLRQSARLLASYGVNLVRVHGPMFDKDGEVDLAKVRHAHEIVAAMKAEGIYTHFSIYFPLWFTPRADLPWLPGYNGNQHPMAALLFNPTFQEKHRAWLKALLTTPDKATGKALLDEPAVFGVELQNEDSFFFWTFDARNIPDAQLHILEKQFGDWLKKKYGSIKAALAAWKGLTVERDAPGESRMGFRPLWNISHEKTPRDRDTAAFLLEVQTRFYRGSYDFLRQLGFKGLIHDSNWVTADPEVLGPLEKRSYMAGDFIDRHGYFECNLQGDNAAWSIRPGHTYSDRSALRFDAAEPGKPRQFVHPVMDPHYGDKPSMISETTFSRPNRYRSEAPLYFAAYGALQDSDCIVHFAFDGASWAVKPGFFMQPWTLATPAMLGQFPAAAILYRQGLVATGPVVTEVNLNIEDLAQLKGTPLPQDASFDELRLKDVPRGREAHPGERLDPLVHYVGRTHVTFRSTPGRITANDLKPFIDRAAQTVASATGELKFDYGKGLLVIDAPRAQGASGALNKAGLIELSALTISCDMDLAHIIAVALDDLPLVASKKILLQVMSEEQASGFETEPVDATTKRITSIGHDPWEVKALRGTVAFKGADAKRQKVTALDFNGQPVGPAGTAEEIKLGPTTLYYVIEP
jgi:hypothetical protein